MHDDTIESSLRHTIPGTWEFFLTYEAVYLRRCDPYEAPLDHKPAWVRVHDRVIKAVPEEDAARLEQTYQRQKAMNDFEASQFTQFRRTNIAEMRPYVRGEDLSHISVSAEDDPEADLGMVARNPKNHADQWYVARQYFLDNFEPLP